MPDGVLPVLIGLGVAALVCAPLMFIIFREERRIRRGR